MTKKKVLNRVFKCVALMVAFALILGILYIVSLFTGTPWGWINAIIVGHQTMEEYKDENYRIAGMGYGYKFGDYYIRMSTPDHIDGDFTVTIDGSVISNDYEQRVIKRQNTANRLREEYRESSGTLIDDFEKKYGLQINVKMSGSIIFADGAIYNYSETDIPSPDAIMQADLVLDKEYDVSEIAKTNGYIRLSIINEERSFERAAELLLNFKEMADERGIAFYAINLDMYAPSIDNGWGPEERIDAPCFLYSDIYEEGLADRIEAAHDQEIERIEQMLAAREDT